MFKKRQNLSFGFAQDLRGFSIAEITVALSVFFLLAAGAFLAFNPAKRLGNANNVQRFEDITAIAKAVELYEIDNDALPSDLAAANINTDHKVVLCSSAASLTCDGQTRDCLVIDDNDFLNPYLGGSLPVDPEKTATTDTGYYITRSAAGKMTFGACSTYQSNTIEFTANATLADYTPFCGDETCNGSETCSDCSSDCGVCAVCGNGTTEGDEVCDDGYDESCGDGITQDGSYCNSTCTGYDTRTEACDAGVWVVDDCEVVVGEWNEQGTKIVSWCKRDCSVLMLNCMAP